MAKSNRTSRNKININTEGLLPPTSVPTPAAEPAGEPLVITAPPVPVAEAQAETTPVPPEPTAAVETDVAAVSEPTLAPLPSVVTESRQIPPVPADLQGYDAFESQIRADLSPAVAKVLNDAAVPLSVLFSKPVSYWRVRQWSQSHIDAICDWHKHVFLVEPAAWLATSEHSLPAITTDSTEPVAEATFDSDISASELLQRRRKRISQLRLS